MQDHPIVADGAWIAARKELLAAEKELTRRRDEVAKLRRRLPWRRVRKAYSFETASGEQSLAELFDRRRQLIVYHFMFDPSWEQGCKSCSLLADHFDAAVVHLRQRDVSFAVVSRAPVEKLLSFQRRMGWKFPWASSFGNDFNRDFHVTFTPEEIASGEVNYNYARGPFPLTEAPGLSVFYRREDDVYHTYSAYARGLDPLIGVYQWLDLTPIGRDEEGLAYTMEWVRHHDRYDDASADPFGDVLGKPRDELAAAANAATEARAATTPRRR